MDHNTQELQSLGSILPLPSSFPFDHFTDGESTDTTWNGKERIREEPLSEVYSLTPKEKKRIHAEWRPEPYPLPSPSKFFSRSSHPNISATIGESSPSTNTKSVYQGQPPFIIHPPLDSRAPQQSIVVCSPEVETETSLNEVTYIGQARVNRDIAQPSTPHRYSPPAWLVSRQRLWPGQQPTEQTPHHNWDLGLLSQDQVDGERGTEMTPINVEIYPEDVRNRQAPIDHSNLPDADPAEYDERAVYEDRAIGCLNEQRALLQGEGFSNCDLLKKPGRACLKPTCTREHMPWPTSGELVICSCMSYCEVCGKFVHGAGYQLKVHVLQYHVGSIFTVGEPKNRKLWTSVRTEKTCARRGDSDHPAKKRGGKAAARMEEMVFSPRTNRLVKRSAEVQASRLSWQAEVIRGLEAEK